MKPGGKAWQALLALILIGSPLVEGGTTYLPVTGLRLVILVLAAGWLRQGLREPVLGAASSRLNLLIVLFWALTAVSLVRSSYPYMTAYWYVNLFFLILLFYLVLQAGVLEEPERERLRRRGATLLILMGAGLSLWAILEFTLGFSTRASAGFFNPNGLAGYLLAISPFALARVLWPESRMGSFAPRKTAAFHSLAVLLMLAAILCTRSRALVVGALPFGALLFLRFRWKALFGLVAALMLLAAVPNPLRERMLTLRQGDPYAWERLRIYEASLEMIRDHPAGVGLGLFKYYYPRYGRAVETVKVGRYEKTAATAHSELLHLAAELSVLAPLLLLGIALPLIAFVLLGARVPPPARDVLGAAAGLLAICAHALIDANLHETAIAVLAVVLAAMLSIGLSESAGGIRRHRLSFRRPLLLKVLLLALTPLLAAALLFISATYGLTEAFSRIPELEPRIQKLSWLAPYNPGYAPLPDALSKALFQMAEQTGQREFLERAIKEESTAQGLNPNNYQYPEGLGVLYLALSTGLNQQPPLVTVAEKYFQLALTLYPNNPFILERLAGIARLRGDWGAEERWLREALTREPYFYQARAELVAGLHQHGQAPAAQKELEMLLAQVAEIGGIVKQRPDEFTGLYQRQLLSLPAGRLDALRALFNRPGGPAP